ncbi:MAG TPA: PQQ-dependent sugar dehydrogenase [Polyangiaceae bacterium]|jgi:glucose/arabinose dehydrogenase
MQPRRTPHRAARRVVTVVVRSVALPLCFACTSKSAALDPEFGERLRVDAEYLTDVAEATDVAFSGDGRALVTLKTGEVVVRRADGSRRVLDYPFGGTLDTGSEKGLLGVVADPDVEENGAFYFYVSNGPTDDKHRVYRAVLSDDDDLAVDATPIVAASRGNGPGLEGPANHDGGGMVIDDGQLYVGVGDTGANASPPTNQYASCLNKGNGKILRVNLDGSVPDDNPLLGVSTVTGCSSRSAGAGFTETAPDPRIFAWGLRNPWRFWIDPETGLLWVGDVGERAEEEISVGSGDRHYGYPFEEGARVWGDVEGMNCSDLTPGRPCSPPAYSYPVGDGASVTGGLIVEGCGWSNVFERPHYVFGDYEQNWVRALAVNEERSGFTDAEPIDVLSGNNAGPVSFRMGPDASLYVVFYRLGAVYRVTPADRSGPGCG